MSTKPGAPPPPPAPQKSAPQAPAAVIPDMVPLSTTSGPDTSSGERIIIYGTGGIGKSTLAAWLPAPYFLDLEKSTKRLNIAGDRTTRTWPELRGKLATIAQSPPKGVRTIVIDTLSAAEEMAKNYVVLTRKAEQQKRFVTVDSIEAFGWGKGWQYVYDEFNGLLADIGRLTEVGLHVCMICHVVSSQFPNPFGEDYIRWEPSLYAGTKKGVCSIRERVKNESEHMLFIGYDVFAEDGKARGSGTRTIYTTERPTHMAKTRGPDLALAFTLQDPGAIWRELGILTA